MTSCLINGVKQKYKCLKTSVRYFYLFYTWGQYNYFYINIVGFVYFRDNKRQGLGVFTWKNGNRYQGDLENGQRHGQGTMTWAIPESAFPKSWH